MFNIRESLILFFYDIYLIDDVRHLGWWSDFSIMQTRFRVLLFAAKDRRRHRRRISRDISDDIVLLSRPI